MRKRDEDGRVFISGLRSFDLSKRKARQSD